MMVFFLPVIVFFSFAHAAMAEEAATNPLSFVVQFYNFGLAIGGLLAFGVIVYAGIQYSLAQGDPGKQSDAKDRVVQAILGLLLLFGAVTLLNFINPGIFQGGLGTLIPIKPIRPASERICSPPCDPRTQTCRNGTCQGVACPGNCVAAGGKCVLWNGQAYCRGVVAAANCTINTKDFYCNQGDEFKPNCPRACAGIEICTSLVRSGETIYTCSRP